MTNAQQIEQGSVEWHAERRLGIGGSDAAAALGVSKWKTPHQLWLEKIGEAAPEDETWEMMRGKALEPALRQHYANTTQRVVELPYKAMVHPKYAFMRYNPDGLSQDGRLVEFKTAGYGKEWGEEQSDQIPHDYLIQVQHGMIVTGRSVCDVTVSVAANAPKYFVVEADRELQEMIIEREHEFWFKVENGIAPDPINNDDVAKIYSRVNGQSITATTEILEAMAGLKNIRNDIKLAEAEKERLEVIIKAFLGENETLLDDFGNTLATWKQQKGARRIDSDVLRANYPDIAASVTTIGDPIRRFLVK